MDLTDFLEAMRYTVCIGPYRLSSSHGPFQGLLYAIDLKDSSSHGPFQGGLLYAMGLTYFLAVMDHVNEVYCVQWTLKTLAVMDHFKEVFCMQWTLQTF